MSDTDKNITLKNMLQVFSFRQFWSSGLRRQLSLSFLLVAVIPLIITAAVVSYRSYSTQAPLALETQSQIAKRVAEQVKSFILERELELQILIKAGDLGNLNRDEQTVVLKNLLSTQAVYDELILLDENGREIVYVSRLDVVTPEMFTTRQGKDEYELPKAAGQTYYGPVSFNDVNGQPFQIITIPIYELDSGNLKYALVANFRFKTVWDLMAQADVVGSGIVYLVDSSNEVVAHANPSIALQKRVVTLPAQNSFTTGLDGEQVALARETIALNEQTFTVVAEQPSSEALALPANNVVISLIIAFGMALLAGLIGLAVANLIAEPIAKLAESAQAIREGDFSRSVLVDRQDEIGNLAEAFNAMSVQLQGTLQGLEQRVADRTKALETVAEVGTAIATILETDRLLQEVVDLTKERFSLYHSHIYLLDETGENLVLATGAGQIGRAMVAEGRSIPLSREQSLVARAARDRKGVTVNDVAQEIGFLPHPLLPDTHAELAVPMIVGENVIGVFDIQSEQVGRFNESDIAVQTTLAAQIATSIQNVRQFEQSKKRADLESLVNVIGQKIQRAASVEEVLQTAARELGTALGASRVSANLQVLRQSENEQMEKSNE